MKIIKPSVEILEQGSGLDGIYKQIELAGRECYASSHKIGENTAKQFVDRMIKSGHGAMLEHGTVYLQMPLDKWMQDFRMEICPGRTHVNTLDETNSAFITTNYRVLVENNALDLLEWLCEKPESMHELRVTARFNTQIAISREYNRHRVNSIAESSTRYCNYSKDKFGNEISINLPTWIDVLPPIPYNENTLQDYCKLLGDNIDSPLASIDWWLFANLACEYSYMKLIENGWMAQQARTVLPLDTNSTLVHTAFVSGWQHFFDLRSRGTTGKPHPDAKVLADQLLQMFVEREYIHE